MADDKLAVKTWLRSLREEQKMSRPDVAEILGVTAETIKNLENPKAGLSHGLTLIRYLRLLGVLADVPVQLPGLGRLAALEEKTDQTLTGIGDLLDLQRQAHGGSGAGAPRGSRP